MLTLLLTFNLLLDTLESNLHNFLPPININSFFLNPPDKIEVKNIIFSPNPSETIGPNSIPNKIVKLQINVVSSQLIELVKSYLFIKKTPTWSVLITGHYRILTKYLKDLCTIPYILKLKLNRKRLYPTISVKYFSVKIDRNPNWKFLI